MSKRQPYILYHTDDIAREVQALYDVFMALPGDVRRPILYHSFKANTFVPLLHFLKDLGMGASVSNIQEFQLARELGFNRICSTSPCLNPAEIRNMRDFGAQVY